jgi:DHA1 family bicyclomycin/chloramphenicol resistance-like MFS transporter
VGIAGEDTAVPMAVVQLAAALVALACFAGMCRPWTDAAAGTRTAGGGAGREQHGGTDRAALGGAGKGEGS